MKPFIAKDTKEPLVVLGGYRIAADGCVIREPVNIQKVRDYGCDPVGDGTYKMIPSGDIVSYDERCRRLNS